MRKTFTILILFTLMFSACSSDDNTPEDTPIERKSFYLLSNVLSQFIVYQVTASGELYTYDYEEGNWGITLSDGDKITVVCKVGEQLLPTVAYKIELDGEVKNLFSVQNTTNYWGFRLMQTADGADHIDINF